MFADDMCRIHSKLVMTIVLSLHAHLCIRIDAHDASSSRVSAPSQAMQSHVESLNAMRGARQIGTNQSNGRVSQLHRHIQTTKRIHISNGIDRMGPSGMNHHTTRSKHITRRGNVHDMTLHHEISFNDILRDFLQKQNIPPELTAEIGQENAPRVRRKTTRIPRNSPNKIQNTRRISRERRRFLAGGPPVRLGGSLSRRCCSRCSRSWGSRRCSRRRSRRCRRSSSSRSCSRRCSRS